MRKRVMRDLICDCRAAQRGLEIKLHRRRSVLANGKTTKELEAQRLALGNSAETAVVDALSIELNGALGEVETLLNDGGELANATALLTKDVLGAGGLDDDLGALGSHADFNARVALLSELTDEELVKLGVEETVGDELGAPKLGMVNERNDEEAEKVRQSVLSVWGEIHALRFLEI